MLRPSPAPVLAALLFALAAPTAGAQAPPGRPALTIERLASYPNLAGTVPSMPVWSPDGTRMAFLWNDAGWPFRDLWLASAAGAKPQRLTDMLGGDPAAPARAAAQPDRRLQGGISAVVWTSNDTLVFLYGGALYRTTTAGAAPGRMLDASPGRSGLTISPDRTMLAFLQGGDAWTLPADGTGAPRRLTEVGQPALGQIPGARFPAPDVEVVQIRWSPDGRHLAVQYNDRRKVRKLLIPNYLGEETTVTAVRRDFPGDRDFVRKVAVVPVGAGGLVFLPLAGELDRRVTGVAWSPDGRELLVDQSSEDAADRWISIVTVDTAAVREVWHERREARVLTNWSAEWQADGRGVLFISDHEGGYRLYSLALAQGAAPRALTPAGVEVVGESGPSPVLVSGTDVFYLSTASGPAERQVSRVSTAGGTPAQVTQLAGTHAPSLSPDGRTLVTLRSDDVTPPELYVLAARGSGGERRITSSPLKEFADIAWARPRYVTFPSKTDGVTLHGRILEPPNLDRTRKYPVVLGPVYANTVRSRWVDREEWRGAFNTLQEYFALEGGYIGFHVDVRGSVGYGREFQDALLRDYGGIDVEDIHSAVEYLKTLPYVDASRIGIWGSSYGGLMTAHSLFRKPGVYAAGVACAPATNVRHATTGEVKVARLPSEPANTYDRMSAVTHASGLRDPLLIVHGMQDDVVLFKDSVTLAEALLRSDRRSFEFAFVPSSVHNWTLDPQYAAYLLGRVAAHFDRHLKPASDGSGRR